MNCFHRVLCVSVVSLWGLGCAGLKSQKCDPCAESEKGCQYDCEAKTLFKWAVCKDEPDANGGKTEKPAVTQAAFQTGAATGAVASELLQNGGNGLASRPGGPREDDDTIDTIVTDRPDFTESSSTVGKGRIQLEMGYTYFRDRERDGVQRQLHTYPELLARIGMFADWFEWRIGQTFGTEIKTGGMPRTNVTGASDLYLGTKIALTEHVHGSFLPESALMLQMLVPTGSETFTGGKVLPGVSYLFNFELTDKLSLAGSVLGNVAVEDSGHKFWLMANSLSLGMSWTDKLGSYFEYFGFYPTGGIDPATKPEYYLNGGFTFLITKNVQYDIRAGFGLNRPAVDFFAGSGLSLRF